LRCLKGFVSVNENGSSDARKPAEYWPMPDLALRDKLAGGKGGEDEDIEIAQVIAHQQTIERDAANALGCDLKNPQ
jgi:hypothetical protein